MMEFFDMSGWAIFGWLFLFYTSCVYLYKRGIKTGIKHSLLMLDLDRLQIEKLNNELSKNTNDLVIDTFTKDKNITYN